MTRVGIGNIGRAANLAKKMTRRDQWSMMTRHDKTLIKFLNKEAWSHIELSEVEESRRAMAHSPGPRWGYSR